jgi:hypothetical protein
VHTPLSHTPAYPPPSTTHPTTVAKEPNVVCCGWGVGHRLALTGPCSQVKIPPPRFPSLSLGQGAPVVCCKRRVAAPLILGQCVHLTLKLTVHLGGARLAYNLKHNRAGTAAAAAAAAATSTRVHDGRNWALSSIQKVYAAASPSQARLGRAGEAGGGGPNE